MLLAATTDGVEVTIASSQAPGTALCTVFVLPPEVLASNTIMVSAASESMVAFTMGHRFLAYKLNLPK